MNTEDFYALPVKERAVLVAKDVIKHVNTEKYIVSKGTYISILEESRGFEREEQIKDKFDNIICRVCALGATIMSCTHLGNKLTFGEINNGDMQAEAVPAISELLKAVFDPHTLLLIETVFEKYPDRLEEENFVYDTHLVRYAHHFGEILSREECIKCNDFSFMYPSIRDRLVAIMENIIVNNGEFIL